MKPRKPTVTDAKAVVAAYANLFGTASFRYDPDSPTRHARDLAARMGWLWITGDRASVTADGMRAVADFLKAPT